MFEDWLKESTNEEKQKALEFLNHIEIENFRKKEKGESEISEEEQEKILEEKNYVNKNKFKRFIGLNKDGRKRQLRILREELKKD